MIFRVFRTVREACGRHSDSALITKILSMVSHLVFISVSKFVSRKREHVTRLNKHTLVRIITDFGENMSVFVRSNALTYVWNVPTNP